MKIAINLLPVVPGRAGGQEVYARGIVQGLLELDDLRHEVVLLTNQFNHDSWTEAPGITRHMVQVAGGGTFGRVWTEQRGLPRVLTTLGIDVVHSLAGAAVLMANCPNVVTIHDLLYLHDVTPFSAAQLWYRRLLVPHSARLAAHVVADSEFTRRDLIDRLHVPAAKVSTVPLGVGAWFRRLARATATGARWVAQRDRYRIREPFLFYVGTLSSHKNIEGLLRAVGRAASRGVHFDVVLAGPGQTPERIAQLRRVADEAGVAERLRPVGYVDVEDLVLFFNNAALHVLPSRFEGFGLTVIEAFACGCPVVASRRASIPELAGDAALLVDPDDIPAMADAICRIAQDAQLAARLRAAGLRRATRWTWMAAAQQLVEIYERCGAAGRRCAPRTRRKGALIST